MRQILLALIVSGICISALFAPQNALLGYVWFALMRPDALAWSTTLPFSMALALATLAAAGLLQMHGIASIARNPFSRTLVLLQIPIALSVVMAVNTNLALIPYQKYIKVIMMSLVIPWLIVSEQWLRRLMLVMACSLGVIALKFGLFSIIHGGVRFGAGHEGLIGDSNGMALAMAMLIPLCWYCRSLVTQVWAKMMLLGMAGCAGITLISTNSRGNSLACGLVLLLITFRSKYRMAGLIGVCLILVLPGLYLVGDRYLDRMSTLTDVQSDNSAWSRVVFAEAAIRMWSDYPLLGVGFGEENYVFLSDQYLDPNVAGRKVHNTYLQMLVDSGIFAFLIYNALLWGTIWWLGRSIKKMNRLRPEWAAYPLMIQSSLLAFAIGSTFYSRGDFELCYMLLMTAGAWYSIQEPISNEMVREATPQPHPKQVIQQPAMAPAAAPAPTAKKLTSPGCRAHRAR
jgi:putative inorganic carbon (HCO3(-)) transporter